MRTYDDVSSDSVSPGSSVIAHIFTLAIAVASIFTRETALPAWATRLIVFLFAVSVMIALQPSVQKLYRKASARRKRKAALKIARKELRGCIDELSRFLDRQRSGTFAAVHYAGSSSPILNGILGDDFSVRLEMLKHSCSSVSSRLGDDSSETNILTDSSNCFQQYHRACQDLGNYYRRAATMRLVLTPDITPHMVASHDQQIHNIKTGWNTFIQFHNAWMIGSVNIIRRINSAHAAYPMNDNFELLVTME